MKQLTATQTKVYKDTKTHNQYNFEGITKGALLTIAQALAVSAKAGNPIAYDYYRFITNYLYDTDKAEYDYVVKANDLK